MAVAEHRYLSFDAAPLFYRRISPDGPAAASFLIIHGMGEHGGRYTDLARAMAGAGIDCWMPDLRGFGLSSGRRGDARGVRDFIVDLDYFYRFASRAASGKPLFILGHSFGAHLACRLAAEVTDLKPRGLILCSPLVRHALPVPAWRHTLAMIAAMVWPAYSEKIPLSPRLLTHDPEILKRDATDPLIHYRITARLYRSLDHSIRTFPLLARRLRCPSLVLQAGDDRVVSAAATESFFHEMVSADKELIVYPGLYHEILNETSRPGIYAKITSWLLSRALM